VSKETYCKAKRDLLRSKEDPRDKHYLYMCVYTGSMCVCVCVCVNSDLLCRKEDPRDKNYLYISDVFIATCLRVCSEGLPT
jgi:hypothetical protein